jgi:hypothetical protein
MPTCGRGASVSDQARPGLLLGQKAGPWEPNVTVIQGYANDARVLTGRLHALEMRNWMECEMLSVVDCYVEMMSRVTKPCVRSYFKSLSGRLSETTEVVVLRRRTRFASRMSVTMSVPCGLAFDCQWLAS